MSCAAEERTRSCVGGTSVARSDSIPDPPDTGSPFAAERATAPTQRLRLDRLHDPLASTPHAHEVTEAYRRAMEKGARFPPISVVRLFGRDWVADGHKRLAAARRLLPPETEVTVEIWSLRRWSADQLRQARAEMAKIKSLPGLLWREPRHGMRLLASSPRHWWRVARSLASRFRSSPRDSPNPPD